jgi:3alpha(or 20beta)-hydroxysteroid dehydrogenase
VLYRTTFNEERKTMTGVLEGRCVLITGAARGLGLRTAHTLAARGAAVALADIDEEAGRAALSQLEGDGHKATFLHLDVTDDASWEKAMRETETQLGGLDVLINNAGIELSDLFIDLDPENMRKVFDVNVVGTALGIKHAFKAMSLGASEGKGGTIVNVSSVAANIAFPGIAAYSASKSAVLRLTKVAAAEAGRLGYGIRVSAICPGLVPNAMGAKLAVDMEALGLFPSSAEAVQAVIGLTPSGRLASEDDIAAAIAFLASDDAAFVNGAVLSVDGAMGM